MSTTNTFFVIVVAVIVQNVTTFPDNGYWDSIPESRRRSFTELAEGYGYTVEQHDVVTEDGYILTLFHIPGNSPIPVLLMHGVMDSADTWIIRGENSLAITLANKGYDVWFANSRGNRYSRRHTKLNPDTDDIFWQFSFNEVGYYDWPASIDTVLNETGATTLSAIGHSQGTTSFFVFGSTRPEYNTKVNIFIALAPVCYLHHSPPPISTFINLLPSVEEFVGEYNINEFLGDSSIASRTLRIVCSTPVIGYYVCAFGILFPFAGYDITELEPSFYPTLAEHFPAGTSARSLVHYLQVGRRKVFAKFDNGPNGNTVLYNSTTPPPYDLGKVNIPIALLAANNDFLSTLADVQLLREQLPNVVYYLVNPRLLFNHIDYVWGRNAKFYINPYILEVLQRYNRFN